MSKIFLCNSNHVILKEFDNVISWGKNYVTWSDVGYSCSNYCNSENGEYFTNDPSKEAELSIFDKVNSLEADNIKLKTANTEQASVIQEQSKSLSMLEDCIVEMAGIVYAS